jgi:hypothetical protein
MTDRPLVRRTPVVDPSVDQWMLDNWTPEAKHVVTVVYRDRLTKGVYATYVDREYRAVCLCGWRSIETPTPDHGARCPVGDALADRAKRTKKITERVEWMPYTTPAVEPDPMD